MDSGIFSKIVVSEEKNKGPHYQSLSKELRYPPSEILVCGDRVAIDLAPAKQLGCKTVQIRWGRGLNSVGLNGEVDYYISDLKELNIIVANL